MASNLLWDMLNLAIPLHMARLKEQGGPTDADLETLAEAQSVLERADSVLLFHTQQARPGEVADAFNLTARAYAILSFCPGGVTFGGVNYSAEQFRQALDEIDRSYEVDNSDG